jgi:Uma2 family endonuclease
MSANPRRADGRVTVADFLRMPEEDGYRLELVRGQVVRESAPGGRHGRLSVLLASSLHQYASSRNLGDVLANTGFVLSRTEHTVRVPDLSFVSAARRRFERLPESLLEGGPDLAVEILSPSNRAGEMREKVADYLAAGCLLVWVVDPRRRRVSVHEPDEQATSLQLSDVLTGDPVLPGFRLPLARLFAD